MCARAESYLHYPLALNPLDPVYLTTMATYGGEHSSFRLYPEWFSTTGTTAITATFAMSAG